MMNICLLIKDFAVGKQFAKNGLPTKSGAEFHGENHARQLMKRGHGVTIMAKKRYWFTKARENLAGIDLVRLHAPFRWLEILGRLFTTHRNADAFYIIGTPAFAVWAILYAKIARKPVILTLTIKEEIFSQNSGWRNKIFAQCDNYIAISREIQRGLAKRTNIPDEKIVVLPQGIDTHEFCPVNEEAKKSLRAKHGLPPDCPVLLFCARIDLRKGVDTLQKIWPALHRKYPTAKFLIVGGGRREYVEALKKMSQETGTSVILAGETAEPAEYYRMSDVYVFPSRAEGLPTTLMEAMATELASVVSDIGGCEDLISDGETGFRVGAEDSAAFVEKISYLFEHSDERRIMGKKARNFTLSRCDYKQVIGRLEQVLQGNLLTTQEAL